MKNHVFCSVAAAIALSVYGACVTGSTRSYLAGPPMICQGFEIGTAASLPVKEDDTRKYDRKKLAKDTLALLASDTPVIVRMETLRRACCLLGSEPGIAKDILLQLAARALDAEAKGKPDRLSWFDAGYFAASLSQLGVEMGFDAGEQMGCVGYLWIKRAVENGKPDAGIEFGAALATHPAMHKGTQETYEKHLQTAAKLAEKGSVIEKNILSHCDTWHVKVKSTTEKETAKK